LFVTKSVLQLEASLHVNDNLMEDAKMRGDQPAWHTREDVGLSATNDALLLKSSVYQIVDKYFSGKGYSADLMREFHSAERHAAMGKCLDLMTTRRKTQDGRVDVSALDMKTYTNIVKFNGAYPTFVLPVALAMRHVSEICASNTHDIAFS